MTYVFNYKRLLESIPIRRRLARRRPWSYVSCRSLRQASEYSTFPAVEDHCSLDATMKLHRLVAEACVCDVNDLPKVITLRRKGRQSNRRLFIREFDALTTTPRRHALRSDWICGGLST